MWVVAYVSRSFWPGTIIFPLELGISSLAWVVLAGHRKNLYVSYLYVDLPLELKISSSLALVVLTQHWKNL